ncbi:MAG: hypothetical protein AAGI48_13615 [Verrucomicrobiota bacterium]
MSVRDTATNPEFKGEVREMDFLKAVILCAEKCGMIDAEQAQKLGDINPEDWGTSFARFVSKDDRTAKDTREMSAVPEGALIAFIYVSKPDADDPAQSTMKEGVRHLLHAMISTGNGRAAGKENLSRLGLGSDDSWQEIDLAALKERWIPADRVNVFDRFSGVRLGGKVSRIVRVRHRMGKWGNPVPSDGIRDALLDAASHVRTVYIDPNIDPGGYIRPTFRLKVSRAVFQEFFNSYNEMRGHYYLSAQAGDHYTEAFLRGMLAKMDWEKITLAPYPKSGLKLNELHHKLIEEYKKSILLGKIWSVESGEHWKKENWLPDFRDGFVTLPPNGRWSDDKRKKQANLESFKDETGLGTRPGEENVLGKMEARYMADKMYSAYGAKYFDWVGEDMENIDVKGVFMNPDDSEEYFMHEDKRYRGSQIKWFGFS